jgi:hypothetical protein
MAFRSLRHFLMRCLMDMSLQLLVARRKNQSDCREGGKGRLLALPFDGQVARPPKVGFFFWV